MDNSYYMLPLNDSSSFEFPAQYPPIASTPCVLSKKPRQQQQQVSKDKFVCHRPQYPDDVPGPINLDLEVISGDVPNVYSKKLKRIYTPTNQILRILFTWSPTYQPLFLRSALLFVDDYHQSTPVQRCYAHRGPELPQNAGVSYEQLSYVFQVSDAANRYETLYETDVTGILTTRTTLRPEQGEAWIDYKFFCQNSCPTGINRRATKLIFLVENANGEVIATRSALIQICSNPKRDKERDESRIAADSSKKIKRKRQPQPPLPPSNSQSTCSGDQTLLTLHLDILGEENYKKVLQFAYDVTAAEVIRTGNHQQLKPQLDAILAKLEG